MSESRPNIIRGIPASRGRVRGTVKVVYNISDLDKVSEGDILVAPMTNPDMVLAMKKAAAIVTDSGGMTSHAAIIARELNIPCVVGTQIATKVLKDGMVVEVDGTKGIVVVLDEISESIEEGDYFIIFGNKVKIFSAKIIRDKPLCPKIDYEWKKPDLSKEYRWIIPRPEIYGSFVQRSLIAAGIERIPYALMFSDLGPLYVRYYNNVAIHYDTIKIILDRLRDNLLNCNEDYWKAFMDRLYKSYEEFNKATDEFGSYLDLFLERYRDDYDPEALSEVVTKFIDWWFIHNRFFSVTYLIQAMGDDIVWPYIRDYLKQIFDDDTTVDEFLSILNAPIDEKDLVTSTRFALDIIKVLNTLPDYIREIIYSNISVKTVLGIIKMAPGGDIWLRKLKEITRKWWWIRERDPYYDPITDESGMIAFIRKYAPRHSKLDIDLVKNKRKYEEALNKIKMKIGEKEFKRFKWLVEIGRILNRERDVHHHIWIKNLSVVRRFFLYLGRMLKNKGLLEHEKDIFFLTIPEILNIVSNPKLYKKEDLINKINIRIAHLQKVKKEKYHREVDIEPPSYFDDIF